VLPVTPSDNFWDGKDRNILDFVQAMKEKLEISSFPTYRNPETARIQ
jgi:hypothetical protein